MEKKTIKTIAQNKKAYHDYFVDEKYEVGIALAGTEVKSIRQGNVNLKDSYCKINNCEIFVVGMHISPYDNIKKDGVSIVPLSLYLKGPVVKMEIGLCRGKKLYDKRDAIAARDVKREIDRSMRDKNN